MGLHAYLALAIILVTQVQSSAGSGWDYDRSGSNGPAHWASSYPICGGSSQSPIDITTASVTYSSSLTALTFENYTVTPTALSLLNNGHAAKVTVTGDLGVSGGGLPMSYKLSQFHFHWGTSLGTNGSEHTINGDTYPLELHLVHYDSATYSSLTNAASNANALAVVGVLFEISATDNTGLNPVIDYLTNVQAYGSTYSLTPFALSALLPNTDNYYRYSGSLTTPSCDETVVWTVLDTKMTVSRTQLAKFYNLVDSSSTAIKDNFRPTQALNGRTVTASFTPSGSSAATSRPARALLATILSILLFKY